MADADDREPPAFSRVLRFSLTDQAATVLWLATLDGLPLLVFRRDGASAAAYYYLAAQIAYGLYFMSGCIGAALVAEGSRDPRRLGELNRRVSRQAFCLVVPTTAAVVIAAPWILRIFGPAYEAHATTLLRLMALSALPYTITSIALSRSRVEQRMSEVVAGHSAIFVLCVGLSALLLPVYGLAGIGVGVLLGQVLVAAIVLGRGLLSVAGQRHRSALLAFLAHTRSRVRHRIAAARLEACLAPLPLPDALRNRRARLLSAHNDVVVAEVSGRCGPAIVKVATRRGARFGLIDHVEALRAVHGDARLSALSPAFPSVIMEGTGPGPRPRWPRIPSSLPPRSRRRPVSSRRPRSTAVSITSAA